MTGVKEFNATLFELTDEMMGLINPSPLMKTGFSVFKTMHAANAENDVAVRAFWDIAKDNQELIKKKDLQAMVTVLQGVIPIPGVVDDVWNALSDENRDIVGEYIVVLNDHASAFAETATPVETKETGNVTMYRMYNNIWKDFIVSLTAACQDAEKRALLEDACDKFQEVLQAKGVDTDMVFGVVFPSLEGVLSPLTLNNEMAVFTMCMPPTCPTTMVQRDAKRLKEVLFPFNRKLSFPDLLADAASHPQLGTYWHYIKLFSTCIHQCPPEVVAIMNKMATLFESSMGTQQSPQMQQQPHDETQHQLAFLRDEQDVLTK